jgi:ketosteroid isomerase-like protein
MSQQNVEIVRSCCEAFDLGEYELALEAFAPDIEYDLTHFPDGRVYRGHDGVREAFRIWMGTWENYRQERDEPIGAGAEVVVPTRASGRGKGSGIELERRTFGVWTMRDGKAVRIRFYPTLSEALEAVGLSEQGS